MSWICVSDDQERSMLRSLEVMFEASHLCHCRNHVLMHIDVNVERLSDIGYMKGTSPWCYYLVNQTVSRSDIQNQFPKSFTECCYSKAN